MLNRFLSQISLKSSLSWRKILIPIASVLVVLLIIFGTVSRQVSTTPTKEIEIAALLPIAEANAGMFGAPVLNGIELAVEEANASKLWPIALKVYDYTGDIDLAKQQASQILDSQAKLAVGPTFSTTSLAVGPIFAGASLASLTPTATADSITQNRTTFRTIFKNSDQGEILADYLVKGLKYSRAAVFIVDNAYGQTLQQGFQQAAAQLDLDPQYFVFTTEQEALQMAEEVVADPDPPPVVLLTLAPEGMAILTSLRRQGVTSPFLGGDAFADELVIEELAEQPEEQEQPGYFSNNLYALAPVIMDSANAETLAFAETYKQRFEREPTWTAVAGYDAAKLAVKAVREVAPRFETNRSLRVSRFQVVNQLLSLDSLERAEPGLLGPFLFDEQQSRQQAIRVGKFNNGHFDSAPIQILPVLEPKPEELASGEVFEQSPGKYAREQKVVYTGVYINEISRVDIANSSFEADFYLWLRFAGEVSTDSTDPTDLIFPSMIGGSFNHDEPVERLQLSDGSQYWLWRVRGEFRNDFDLKSYPFDSQTLSLPFSNARSSLEQIVYVIDRRSDQGPSETALTANSAPNLELETGPTVVPHNTHSVASPQAFRQLSRWKALEAIARRDNLVTNSALGNPELVGVERQRELSGFLVTVEIERRALTTLAKSLLPLLIMSLILFASLFFPAELTNQKVTVAVTGALSGAVLLTNINNQLGGIGYTIALEYVFYLFFLLTLSAIVSAMLSTKLRVANRAKLAKRIERFTRLFFVAIIAGALVGALCLFLSR